MPYAPLAVLYAVAKTVSDTIKEAGASATEDDVNRGKAQLKASILMGLENPNVTLATWVNSCWPLASTQPPLRCVPPLIAFLLPMLNLLPNKH